MKYTYSRWMHNAVHLLWCITCMLACVAASCLPFLGRDIVQASEQRSISLGWAKIGRTWEGERQGGGLTFCTQSKFLFRQCQLCRLDGCLPITCLISYQSSLNCALTLFKLGWATLMALYKIWLCLFKLYITYMSHVTNILKPFQFLLCTCLTNSTNIKSFYFKVDY